jgi:hypothetical protein
MVSNRERAQVGLELIKEAILLELKEHPLGMKHAAIVSKLRLESDFEGGQKNYLSWSILGILLGEGKIKYTGEHRNRTYFLIAGSSADGVLSV